ncbi:phage major capsid protein [Paenibacillus gallinarum]|uniref:Phage major capsid protein n=1 Tax=Paenibacillus gallinarum TaxID=2762232 RepID=A0ABR8SWQ0_9BACL|nr:phage major capsid protein [Paenibacillus gallinarum]MBD7967759.1 phage major capsid protein [Paenibacillus gallinarum]
MPTIYQMKQNLAELGAELRSVSEEIRSKSGDPSFKIEELRNLKVQQKETEERFDLLKEEIDTMEKEARSKLEMQDKQRNPLSGKTGDEQRMVAAKADMIRSIVLGKQMSEEARNLLAAIPANHASGGSKFMPTNMSNELISEPLTTNPLRGLIKMTNITGLEVPKISYTLDDDDFITDEQTAKEIKLTGDKVTFGRNKFKVKARISDTVLHGSDLALTAYVENALRSGLAAKEKKVALTASPKTGEEHMSFYSTANAITEVTGADTYKAIKAAIATLHEDYRENAKIMMTYSAYSDIIETLANGNAALYTAPPETVLGKPVIFSDSAVKPIVGDFNYAQFNYDIDMVYDSDKDVDKGEYLFVLTAWFDMQILLKSAFRIAKVVATP